MEASITDVLRAPYAVEPPEPGEVLIIVGEPGMGKTRLAMGLLRSEDRQASRFEAAYLSNASEDVLSAVSQVRKAALSHLRGRSRRRVRVLIDGYPSVSEDVLASSTKTLRAMTSRGISVVVTLRPEAEQLVDALPEARVVRAPDLLYALPAGANGRLLRAWGLTNGIPLLVRALDVHAAPDAHYLEALTRLAGDTFRAHIPQSEREARVAMLLLGEGTVEELSEVARGADEETLSWLEHEAPIFGIQLYGGSFRCAGLADDDVLRQCHSVFRRLDESFEEVIRRSYEVLLARRSYARAGMCCSLVVPADRRARLAVRAGAELALCGSAAVVVDGVVVAGKLGLQEEPGFAMSRAAVQILSEPYDVAQFAFARLGVGRRAGLGGRAYAHVALLMASRNIDAGKSVDLSGIRCAGSLAEALTEHMAARCLLLDGRPTEALERLCELTLPEVPSTVPEALLAGDLLLAQLLCTREAPSRTRSAVEHGSALLERSQLRRLCSYQRALSDLASLLAGGVAYQEVERAIHQAEVSGDTAVYAALLLAKGISELRRGSVSTAHVCFGMAATEASDTVFVRLSSCARLLDALTLSLLGESGRIASLLREGVAAGSVADIARLLVAAGCDAPLGAAAEAQAQMALGTAPSVQLGTLSPIEPSRDALWLMALVARDFGRVSERFVRSLSEPWHAALLAYGVSHASVSEGSNKSPERMAAGPQTGAPSELQEFVVASPPAKPVQICLLGGFRVLVRGRVVPPAVVRRRRGGQLLALLAAREGHVMRREEVIDNLWGGDAEFERTLQRLYEATSMARNTLEVRSLEMDPFLKHLGVGAVGLNPEVIDFDVDELERAVAACVRADGGDGAAVEDACKVRELYVGDLDVLSLPDRPWVHGRRDRLRQSFVDSMVLGARAGLRLGRVGTALMLAEAAAASDDHREDVVAIHMRCLAASDRVAEVHEVFERFSLHITALTHVPPSKRLRRLANELAPLGHESSASWEAYDGEIGAPEEEGGEGLAGEEPVAAPRAAA